VAPAWSAWESAGATTARPLVVPIGQLSRTNTDRLDQTGSGTMEPTLSRCIITFLNRECHHSGNPDAHHQPPTQDELRMGGRSRRPYLNEARHVGTRTNSALQLLRTPTTKALNWGNAELSQVNALVNTTRTGDTPSRTASALVGRQGLVQSRGDRVELW
jgi:hypothetical protein